MAEDDLRNEVNEEGGLAEDGALSEQMRALLRRVEAPDGFTERLLARVEASAPTAAARAQRNDRGLLLRFTRPVFRMAYAAAALLALTAGAFHIIEHARTEQRRAEQASAQFDTALEVTDHALNHVAAKLETSEFGQVQRALEANGGGK